MNTPTMTQPQELDLSQLQQVAGGVQSVEAKPQWDLFPTVSVPPALVWEAAPLI